jgi:prepilin-type N-terminal cleavage/methylation domain-containing protein
MKTPRTDKGLSLFKKLYRSIQSPKAFTLIELLVVIGIIALLASIALPAFSSVQRKAQQSKALTNAKQIGFACKSFGVDNNGQFPNYPMQNGVVSGSTQVTTANDAFNDLTPTYLATVQCFYQPGSFETPLPKAPTDPDFTSHGSQSTTTALPANTNHWAYVTGMSDTANSSFPLIVNNPASIGSGAVSWSGTQTAKGGVWQGKQALVVHVDDSATVDQLNTTNEEDMSGPTGIDLFDTTGQKGWMQGNGSTGNNVVPALTN